MGCLVLVFRCRVTVLTVPTVNPFLRAAPLPVPMPAGGCSLVPAPRLEALAGFVPLRECVAFHSPAAPCALAALPINT